MLRTAVDFKSILVPIDRIALDGVQSRVKVSEKLVREYARFYKKDPSVFPPVELFDDGEKIWVGSGIHRILAAMRCGSRNIHAIVRSGTRRDAVLFAVKSNAEHGKPRSRDDKHFNIILLLRDEEWGKRSSSWIAEECRVTHDLVEEVRLEFEASGDDASLRELRHQKSLKKVRALSRQLDRALEKLFSGPVVSESQEALVIEKMEAAQESLSKYIEKRIKDAMRPKRQRKSYGQLGRENGEIAELSAKVLEFKRAA